jgi:hypothetical protein
MSLWPEAGQALGLGRNATYEAARRGQIPIIKFGKLSRCQRQRSAGCLRTQAEPQQSEVPLSARLTVDFTRALEDPDFRLRFYKPGEHRARPVLTAPADRVATRARTRGMLSKTEPICGGGSRPNRAAKTSTSRSTRLPRKRSKTSRGRRTLGCSAPSGEILTRTPTLRRC